MKTPDYHNPQGVPESALKPGERFLLREEVGTESVRGKCTAWGNIGAWQGHSPSITYKTTLPLPPEYQEPDYGDPEYRKSVERAFRDGKRVQYRSKGNHIWQDDPSTAANNNWAWDMFIYRIHPDDIDKEVDWTTPEKQAEVRRMWAENPAMEREGIPIDNPNSQPWLKEIRANYWDGKTYYYRPAQKPREKSQSDKDKEAAENHYCFTRNHGSQQIDIEVAFLAGVNYAREVSRKGVA